MRKNFFEISKIILNQNVLRVYYILFSIILFKSIFSQTNYSIGFKDGYKIGYCYNNSLGCIPPIVPVTPILRIGESLDSYFDGYNRGLIIGSEAIIKKNNDEIIRNEKSMQIYGQQSYIPKIKQFKPDFSFYKNIMAMNQERYEQTVANINQSKTPELDSKLAKIVEDANDPDKIQTRINYVNFIKSYYSSLGILPKTIPDGKYRVTLTWENEQTKQASFDENVEVGVGENKISVTKEMNQYGGGDIYFISVDKFKDYKSKALKNGYQPIIKYSTNIINGTCQIIKSIYFANEDSYAESYTCKVYFFDYILKYQETQNKIKDANKKYASLTSYKKPTDGLHIAYVHNNEDRFEQVNILVENGKIKSVNMYDKEYIVVSGGEIIKNKSSISVTFTYADGSNPKLFFFDVLLL